MTKDGMTKDGEVLLMAKKREVGPKKKKREKKVEKENGREK